MIIDKIDTLDNLRKLIIDKYKAGKLNYVMDFHGMKIYASNAIPHGECHLIDVADGRTVAKIIGIGNDKK